VSVVRLGGRTRYRLLETLRDYARNRLSSSPELQEIQDAHLRWAVAYAQEAGGRVLSPEQDRVLEEIAANMDDLRAALGRALEAGDHESGLRLIIGLDPWWQNFALREARHWLTLLLAQTESISPVTLGRGLSTYAVVLAIHGEDDRAMELQERARALLREVGDARGVAWSTHYLAIGHWQLASPEEVKRLSLEALSAFEELHEPVGMGRSLWWLILWELEFGSVEEALRYGSRLQELGSRMPGPLLQAHVAEAAGLLARVQGDLEEAGRLLHLAVGMHARIRNLGCLSHCLEHVALWSLDRKKPEQAATLLGTVDAIREDVVGSTAVPPFERMWHDRGTNAAREALGAEGFTDAWARGRAMNVEQAIAMGLAADSA
jgi:non-specific serine/threonine protein kinase